MTRSSCSSASASDFLKKIFDYQMDITKLPYCLMLLADDMKLGQIHVAYHNTESKFQDITPYKRYDTLLLNEPDYVYFYSIEKPDDVSVQFWKMDPSVIWEETDIQNMIDLSRFLLIYLGHYKYLHKAKYALTHDDFTGLVNLNGFTQTLADLINHERASKYSIVCLSAFRFRMIHQEYGHDFGSRISYQMANNLKVLVESFSTEHTIARLINDSFAILIQNTYVDQFIDTLSEFEINLTYGQKEIRQKVLFNIGIYHIKESDTSPALPIEYAMAAYALSRQSNKPDIVFYNNEVQQLFLREREIETKMHDALNNKEFLVYYQPKIDLNSLCICGAEALVRWSTEKRILAPIEFIPIFERNGFICSIDFFVLEKVCKDLRNWLDQGYDVVPISVNFSRVHLADSSFAEKIVKIVKKHRIPTRYIEIEFTESAEMEDSEVLIHAIDILKSYGISCSMDDFGTGYSSLSLLTDTPVDVLKIDKSLLDADTVTSREKVILSNIVRMVRALNIDVIMEGVETVEQADFLKQINCTHAQGFLFDKPLPLHEFEQRLKKIQYEDPSM